MLFILSIKVGSPAAADLAVVALAMISWAKCLTKAWPKSKTAVTVIAAPVASNLLVGANFDKNCMCASRESAKWTCSLLMSSVSSLCSNCNHVCF